MAKDSIAAHYDKWDSIAAEIEDDPPEQPAGPPQGETTLHAFAHRPRCCFAPPVRRPIVRDCLLSSGCAGNRLQEGCHLAWAWVAHQEWVAHREWEEVRKEHGPSTALSTGDDVGSTHCLCVRSPQAWTRQ